MRQIPLSIPFTGYYHWVAGALNARGSYGFFWTSRANSTAYARNLAFYDSAVYPQNAGNKESGLNIRCVKQ